MIDEDALWRLRLVALETSSLPCSLACFSPQHAERTSIRAGYTKAGEGGWSRGNLMIQASEKN